MIKSPLLAGYLMVHIPPASSSPSRLQHMSTNRGILYLPSSRYSGPETGERPSAHGLRGLHPSDRQVRTDGIGPGQVFAAAAIERCSRIMVRDSGVTSVRFRPAME